MTRTTLKALWFGGGGVLATWLAVSPNQGGPASSQPQSVARPGAAAELNAEHLTAQTDRIRERSAAAGLLSTTRNPFQFTKRSDGVSVPQQVQPMTSAPMFAAAQAAPDLTLAGIAEQAGKRTAIVSGGGQVYLVGEGDLLAGRYTVVSVDPSHVLIRDTDGAERRLLLPR